ncbi:MAG: bifunctional adenosylcobinamide kinase/adenosylcobinamide-phosphate guanylyltransferase [Blautia massiliensis (ex Durand et al. 2017)]
MILVSEEVGYGIVPADAFERQYREAVGRVCTALAAKKQKGHKSGMRDRDGAEG